MVVSNVVTRFVRLLIYRSNDYERDKRMIRTAVMLLFREGNHGILNPPSTVFISFLFSNKKKQAPANAPNLFPELFHSI